MALIVENGSQVAGANTYAAMDAIRAYALARGVTLGLDSQVETFNSIAIDYLEGKRKDYLGSKVAVTQSLQFPRVDLIIDGFDFPSTSIPNELIRANCQLIVEQSLGINILPTQNNPAIKSESVGPIKTDYAVNPGSVFEPYLSAVDLLLAPLMKSGSGGFGLTFMRV